MIKRIKAKFGNMKKAEDFVVYPQSTSSDNKEFLLQSDHRFLIIDKATGKGFLSRYVANYPRILHCHPLLGATVIVADKTIMDACAEAQPKKGDDIGGGVAFIG